MIQTVHFYKLHLHFPWASPCFPHLAIMIASGPRALRYKPGEAKKSEVPGRWNDSVGSNRHSSNNEGPNL